MTEILFYHLTESRVEDALPPLLEKSLGRGWRVALQTGSAERRDALDQQFWTYAEDSFLPHGSETSPDASIQPILICTTGENANAAQVRFLVDRAEPSALETYERAVFMFDGHDQMQVEAARTQWKTLKGAGHTLTYWQQNDDRRWEKKA